MKRANDILPFCFFIGIALVFGNSIFNLYGFIQLKYSFILIGHIVLLVLYFAFTVPRDSTRVFLGLTSIIILAPYIALSFLQGHQVFDVVNLYLLSSSILFFLLGTALHIDLLQFRGSKLEKAVATFYFLIFLAGLLKFNEISVYDVSRNLDDYGLHPVGVAVSFGFLCQVSLFNAINSKSWTRVVWALASLEAFLIVFSTGSRGAVVAIVFLNAILAFHFFKRIKVFLSLCGFTIGVIIVWSIGHEYLSTLPFFDRIQLAFDRARAMLTPGDYGYVDLSGRREIWRYYMDTLGDWILLGERGYIPYPHNSILEMFVRFGVLGIFPAIVAITILILASIKLFSKSLIALFEAQMFFLDFLISMVNGSLEMHRFIYFGIGYFIFSTVQGIATRSGGSYRR